MMAVVAAASLLAFGAKVARYQLAGPVTRLGSITTLGRHVITPGKLEFEAYEDRGGINYRVIQKWQRLTMQDGQREPPIEKGAAWFAFAETPERLWVYNGRGVLTLQTFHPAPNTMSDSRYSPEIVTSAPRGVRDMLPKEFKDRSGGN